jgi:hypothetical protein
MSAWHGQCIRVYVQALSVRMCMIFMFFLFFIMVLLIMFMVIYISISMSMYTDMLNDDDQFVTGISIKFIPLLFLLPSVHHL